MDAAEELRLVTQRFFRRFGAFSADATPCGKPIPMVHAHALMTLLAQGELSQQQLGSELCIDKSNVARLCTKMVEAGHVLQRADAEDARSRRVSLTARGERLAREVNVASKARFGALLQGVPASRRSGVIESLKLLVAALEESEELAQPRMAP